MREGSFLIIKLPSRIHEHSLGCVGGLNRDVSGCNPTPLAFVRHVSPHPSSTRRSTPTARDLVTQLNAERRRLSTGNYGDTLAEISSPRLRSRSTTISQRIGDAIQGFGILCPAFLQRLRDDGGRWRRRASPRGCQGSPGGEGG